MYLKGLYIENNGPLSALTLDFPFTADGLPKPVVLVGANGSGKTNLLSIIADALFEGAAQHFTDVTPVEAGTGRPWFRLAGASTVRVGAAGSVSLLRFEHDDKEYFFKEKAGAVDPEIMKGRVPEEFKPQVTWPEDTAIKEFEIGDKVAADIFSSGVYTYFPSSRAEVPHWLNQDSLPEDPFNLKIRRRHRLGKPIYLEKSLEPLKQWLLALLVDVRADVSVIIDETSGQPRLVPTGDQIQSIIHAAVWNVVNSILKTIIGQEDIRLVWRGRRHVGLAVAAGKNMIIPDLDALSAGQSILLGMFGTLIRYADISRAGTSVLSLSDITGICLVDEIDAHMHIDLQHDVLPSLIKLFPKIQFIVSSHSPLFVLGIEKAFGPEGVVIIDMPMGALIQAEAYAEFGRAFEVLKNTKAFNHEIAKATETPGKLLVLLEGETDPIYLQTAAELLDSKALLDKVEFAWVGAKDPKGGQSFHTGKDALNATLKFLRANPELVKRTVLLLYDGDANKPDETHDRVFVRSVHKNPAGRVKSGIENLLPVSAITQGMYDVKERNDGGKISTLNKMKLCTHLCEAKRDPKDFDGFSPLLDMVKELIQIAELPQDNDEG